MRNIIQPIRRYYDDLICAGSVLTRFPVGRFANEQTPWDLARSTWCWPLYGAVIGALSAGLFLLLKFCGASSFLAAPWAILCQVLLTGGLHEDGLADTMDGLGSGKDTATKLTIMRDSRIGSFGALALLLYIAIRVTALATLPDRAIFPALAISATLARAAMPILVTFCPAARPDGLAKQLTGLSKDRMLSSLFCAFCLALLLLPHAIAFLACTLTLGLVVLMRYQTLRHLNGFTGDILGATVCCVEAATLTLFAMLLT
nr:adenosylcobinamide-GDP ribazoletransferase [uncultured Neokomagataea sp.]